MVDTPDATGHSSGEPNSYPWCVSVSSCGEFLVWTAAAAKWLRKDCRIIGRASYAVEVTAKSTGPSSNIPNRLPIRLSFEETAHLLNSRMISGLTVSPPVSQLDPPTPEQTTEFAKALEMNRKEMQELFQTKRRLELSGYYTQLVQGLSVSKQRHAEELDSPYATLNASVEAKKLPVRQRRKMLRLQKKRLRSSGHTRSVQDEEVDSDSMDADEVSIWSGPDPTESPPTLGSLIDYYERGRAEPMVNPDESLSPHENYRDVVPRHYPRPTPVEWLRPGEVERVPLPDNIMNGDLFSVISWLNEQQRTVRSGADSSSTLTPNSEEILRLRCQVFSDLWSKGYYVTTSSAKMGGDFLVYPGDPLLFHASHIVNVQLSGETVQPHQLAAKLRLANSVRKILVLATVSPGAQSEVVYTSFTWTNWLRRT